ncbi:MAG: hypothetical protein KBG28_15715 [Kofleriaceae bacterium]|nr:hypothetical protein [Kofleriaceae bacterium]
MRNLGRFAGLVLVTVLLAPTGVAWAQETDAERLFREGRDLLAQNKLAQACAKFEESLAKVDHLGPRMNLALCLEKRNQVHSAVRGFEYAEKMAIAAGETELAQAAREHINALRPRVPRVVVEVEGAVPGQVVVIKRPGKADVAATAGEAMPMDPTDPSDSKDLVTVVASASGHETYATEARPLPEGREERFVVPPLTPAGAGGGGGGGGGGGEGPIAAPRVRTKTTLGYVLLGGGVAFLGGSLAYNLREKSKAEATDCNAACVDRHNGNMKKYGTTLFGVGLAAVAAGTYFAFFHTSAAESATRSALVPVLGPDQVGLSLSGGF